ncbi:hypothetical protein ACTJK3_08505 [Pseudomonas sp. 22105]|jgi:hypothetical protein|uniref:Uncharacterized protein n=1 Tax=Pseudomonas glycinae TaxID=1785145 RepID=A0ABN4ML65_9PSED|nr:MULTISPECIES: hypothetical protein [Pseudomonas]AMQ82637.1 hypothetical protein AWU82_04855 [Pseudomonas glycinae]AWA37662.1 hypothetical protein DBV33_03305 [Pseudomonas fluorescens]NKF29043.1 hypothetical protein [Pseudomonas sp. BG5]
MRLVHHSHLTDTERLHVYPVDQALEWVCKVLLERQSLEGLDQLRAGLMLDLDSEVLEHIERGEWLLLRAEADDGEWSTVQSAFDQAVLDLMNNPPPQPTRTPRIYRLVESMTGEPLPQQPYIATVDGIPTQRRTDAEGIAHLFMPDDARQISMRIFNV